jgi:hypothetical protein
VTLDDRDKPPTAVGVDHPGARSPQGIPPPVPGDGSSGSGWTYTGGQPKPGPTTSPPWQDPKLAPPPPVPGGADTPGKGVTTINTKAMQTYASNIDALIQPLRDSANALQSVNIKPGVFPAALELSKSINTGETGLRDASYTVLNNLVNALVDVHDALRLMASKYDKAEDLNEISAGDYANYMAIAAGRVNAVIGTGSGS